MDDQPHEQDSDEQQFERKLQKLYAQKQKKHVQDQVSINMITQFPFLRPEPMPQTGLEPYAPLHAAEPTLRHRYQEYIFNFCANIARLLVLRGLYLFGNNLQNYFIYKKTDNNVMIQLYSPILTTQPQPSEQFVQLALFLDYTTNVLQTDDVAEYLFQGGTDQGIREGDSLEDMCKMVRRRDDINLIEDRQKNYFHYQQLVQNEALLNIFKNSSNYDEVWTILARIVSRREAIRNLSNVPEWLGRYINYDGRIALPDIFVSQTSMSDEEALRGLRMALGVYPEKIDMVIPLSLNAYANEIAELPLWYRNRVLQLGYVFSSVRVNETNPDIVEIKENIIVCGRSCECLIKLCNLV